MHFGPLGREQAMPLEGDFLKGFLGKFYEQRLLSAPSLDGIHPAGDLSARGLASLTRFGERDVGIGA
jgi:hypothetical protein